jgi:hypothetical protein
MAHGRCQSFNAVIASATTTSAEVDLGTGFARVCVDIAGAVSTDVSFQAALPTTSGASTYRFLRYPVASGVTAPATALVGSACSGFLVEVGPLAGHRFIKVVARSAVADGATIKLICSDL